jgi:predicted nucleic acid-binding protein
MNGKRYLLDTNAVVALLRGNPSLLELLRNAEWVGISVISQIEFLAFAGLGDPDRAAFDAFAQRADIIGLTAESRPLIQTVIELRQQHRLKLPDAIIAATALCERASLVTADQQIQSTAAVPVVRF